MLVIIEAAHNLPLPAKLQKWGKEQLNEFHDDEKVDDPCLKDALKEMN